MTRTAVKRLLAHATIQPVFSEYRFECHVCSDDPTPYRSIEYPSIEDVKTAYEHHVRWAHTAQQMGGTKTRIVYNVALCV